GYEVVLVNSNPATIMTDPEMADRTYVEPLTVEVLEKVIAREKPDVLLPTLGGQTGLNLAIQLCEQGILEKYGVELIGANHDAIAKAEDRDLFKQAMERIGLSSAESGIGHTLEESMEIASRIGFPVVVRPAYTLGGTGGGVAYNREEFRELARKGLEASMVTEILIEQSLVGWKEFELEVMRDHADNVVIICAIENIDPMGVHTGDSITVAPAQTLTDREYQRLRDASIQIIREIGVETGGSNIQFAVSPTTGEVMVIEMNPRVSRSSALASKATGFPIAKIAAKLAVGYTLDEIPNDITRETPSCFEPTIDYCVIKIPRFTFEKFPAARDMLTTSMKSVGEAMAIGRTFKESLQKGLRSMEIKRMGFGADGKDGPVPSLEEIRRELATPNSGRFFMLHHALKSGMSVEEIYDITWIDPWFLANMKELVDFESTLAGCSISGGNAIDDDLLKRAKSWGYSDVQLAHLMGCTEDQVRKLRFDRGIEPGFRLVDTCGGEFEAYTPYYYSSYDQEDETRHDERKKIMILGGGPNRIGQGIEFDYCCVHASMAVRDSGLASIMVNCNPETVSTDYDTSDRLYFEPLTLEDVLSIVRREKPDGVIVQFGGQTPLNLAVSLEKEGVPIVGTSPDSIDRAEDRGRFSDLCTKLDIRQTDSDVASSMDEAAKIAERLGYPVIVRPSFVLGGRGMEIVYDESQLERYLTEALKVSEGQEILVDKYLEDAIEIDVDALSDGTDVYVGGLLEHIEQAGVHSGDAGMVLPPHTLPESVQREIEDATTRVAIELGVKGLLNLQLALTPDGKLYVLEVNPRASRTVPFVSKVTGVPLARLATFVMLGKSLKELGYAGKRVTMDHVGVKESVFPFDRFPGVDAVLGPEMRSTGEVMGIDAHLPLAFAKSQMAVGTTLPTG
ncbi:MAG: carbamoyl-phosphate synthase large subunit, partial [Planctomycetota bacterium]